MSVTYLAGTCCCGEGDGDVSVPCCPVPVPRRLFVNLHNVSGCDCADGFSATLDYDDGQGAWVTDVEGDGAVPVPGCDVFPDPEVGCEFLLFLQCSAANRWEGFVHLRRDDTFGTCFASFSELEECCDPFILRFEATFAETSAGHCCCEGGTVLVEVLADITQTVCPGTGGTGSGTGS